MERVEYDLNYPTEPLDPAIPKAITQFGSHVQSLARKSPS